MGRSSSYNQSRASTQSKNSGALNTMVQAQAFPRSSLTNHELGIVDQPLRYGSSSIDHGLPMNPLESTGDMLRSQLLTPISHMITPKIYAEHYIQQVETPKHIGEHFIQHSPPPFPSQLYQTLNFGSTQGAGPQMHHIGSMVMAPQYSSLNRSQSVHNQTQQSQQGTRPASPSQQKGSLNYMIKKKEAARIDRENEKIMKSLLNQTPALSQKKMEEHQKMHDKLKKLLNKNKNLPTEHLLMKKRILQNKVGTKLPPVGPQHKNH